MVTDLQACWQGRFGQHRNGVIWMAAPHCLMWYLWRERNDQQFEDSEWSLSNLKLFFFKTLLDWMSVVGSIFTCSVCDLIYHCNFRA